MWRESATTASARARVGAPSSPLWIAVFATGQDLATDGSIPRPGIFYIFGSLCAFWESDAKGLETVESLGIGGQSEAAASTSSGGGGRHTTKDDYQMYRWSYATIDDIVCEDDMIRLSASQRGFKLTKIDEYASVVRSIGYLRTATLEELQDSNDVDRSGIMYPESTQRVKMGGAVKGESEEKEYVVQEIDGAIVTNLRIFYGTSVVKMGNIQMMRRGPAYLTASINKGLAITLRCSPHRQGLVIRLWLAKLAISAYWDSTISSPNSPLHIIAKDKDQLAGSGNDGVSCGNFEQSREGPTGISSDEFERKRQIVILERLHKQFCAIDESGNGLIEEGELDAAMGPVFASPSFVSCFFRALDTDGDKVITFIEFASGMSDLLTSNVMGKIRFSFRMFDVDGDGAISESEMLDILRSLASTGDVAVGEDIMEEVCEGLFALIDLDGSGVISTDEYAEALQSNPQVHELLRRIGLQADKHNSKATIADLAEDMICFGDEEWLLCSSITQALLISLNQVRSNCTTEHSETDTGSKAMREPTTQEFLSVQKVHCNVAQALVQQHGYVDDTQDDTIDSTDSSLAEVVIYAPKVFDYLRSVFRITLQDYQTSLGLKNIAANMLLGSVETLRQPQWDAQHRFSFVSNNNRFLVHALSAPEVAHLLRILPQYASYVKTNPNTLLPRIVGIHAIVHANYVMPFIVICNTIRSEDRLWGTFKLQGIPERVLGNGQLSEADLKAPFHLAPGWKAALTQQLNRDVSFLSASNCVNYTLAVAVHRAPTAVKVDEKSDFIKQLEIADKKQQRKKKSSGFSCCAADNVMDEDPPEDHQERKTAPLTVGKGSKEDGPATLEDSTMFAQTSRQEGDLPPLSVFNEYFGGVKAHNDDPFFFGLVDIYHSAQDHKGGQHHTSDAAAVDDYRERFLKYTKQWIVGEEEGDNLKEDGVKDYGGANNIGGGKGGNGIPEKLTADMLQFPMTRENGRKGTAGIDVGNKCIFVANHTGNVVDKIDLSSKDHVGAVYPYNYSEKNKCELTLRCGYKDCQDSGLPSFSSSHRFRFPGFNERTEFLSEITKIQSHVARRHPGLQTSTAKIFIGTWNVGDTPPADMKPFLNHIQGADLVVLSLQECNYQVKGSSATKTCESDFFGLVTSYLTDYVAVVAHSLWTIRMLVLVKKNQAHRVSNVRHCTEATGIGHVMGNKGGIAVGLRFDASYLCFVGSHLAAHLEKVDARNSDVKEIIEGVSPKLGVDGVDILGCYHHVFWCGDLNYRLNWDFPNVLEHCVKNNVAPLYPYDQLQDQMKKGRVFLDFKEPMPTFTPTYRFLRDTDPESPRLYDEWKHRIPSWCDRVLHKGLGNTIDTALRTSYQVEHAVRSSDHSPVFAMFDTQIRGGYVTTPSSPHHQQPSGAAAVHLRDPAAVHPTTATTLAANNSAASLSITNLKCHSLLVADTFGLSDPWIGFLCQLFSAPLKDAKTRTIWKTLNPEWSEAFELPFFHNLELAQIFSEYVVFLIKDADYVGTHDPLGQVILPLDIFITRPFEPQNISLPIILHGERHGTLSATVQLKPATK